MSGEGEGNTAMEALANSDQLANLQKIVAELQAKVDAYEGRDVVEGVFNGEVPRYKLNTACYLEDDTRHDEGEEIEYTGTPNMEMVPLNEAAKKRLQGFIAELTQCAKDAAQLNGRPFRGLIMDSGDAIAVALADSRRAAGNTTLGNSPIISLPTEKGQVPVMPHTPEAAALNKRQGKPGRPKMVVSAKAPPNPSRGNIQGADVLGSEYTRNSAKVRGS